MAKILVVEDDIPLANILSTWLETQNYVVDMAYTGEDALQLLSNFQYDVLILDWELPGIAGINVCKIFRQKGGNTPILFLTGKTDISSKVEGLETGADDYLSKPFEYRELGARIRSLLRRPAGILDEVLTLAGLSLDVKSRTAVAFGRGVLLTPREFSLLEFLMRHPDRAFGSKALLDAVWPLDSALSEDTVRSCMRTLRKKISSDAGECAVRTIQSQGYLIESKPGTADCAEAPDPD
jgi:DNA-binding response OmpR family regulator